MPTCTATDLIAGEIANGYDKLAVSEVDSGNLAELCADAPLPCSASSRMVAAISAGFDSLSVYELKRAFVSMLCDNSTLGIQCDSQSVVNAAATNKLASISTTDLKRTLLYVLCQ